MRSRFNSALLATLLICQGKPRLAQDENFPQEQDGGGPSLLARQGVDGWRIGQAAKRKGLGKAPAPVLRDVLLYLRRLASVMATGRHLPLSCLPPSLNGSCFAVLAWMSLHPFHPSAIVAGVRVSRSSTSSTNILCCTRLTTILLIVFTSLVGRIAHL
jgi:hypothetical protein